MTESNIEGGQGIDDVTVADALIVVSKRESTTVSVRAAGSGQPLTFADFHAAGRLSYGITGTCRQGEAGVLAVCEILVRKLNLDGGQWGKPLDVSRDRFRREEGVDCEVRGGDRILQIQVTRADQEIWESLATVGTAERTLAVGALANALRVAIDKKAKRFALAQRLQVLLALDATETAAFALESTVAAFRAKHGIWAKQLGHFGIWIVGPNETLTSCLDG